MGHKVVLTFRDTAQKEPFRLHYELFANSFTQRWVAALLKNGPSDTSESQPLNYFSSGALFTDEAVERSTLDRQIREIENEFQISLIKTPLRSFSTGEDFEPLKKTCLELLDKHAGMSERQVQDRKKISALIQTVLHYESLYHPDHHFQCDLKVHSEHRYFFKSSEYELFTMDRRDGWLYLDYGQTGLPPITAYLAKSNELPTPQDSFIGSFQIVYREDFSYSDLEKDAASKWLHQRLRRRKANKRDQLGQIPLGRPTHSFSRIEVLNQLLAFRGQVEIEILDGNRKLDLASLKQELKNASRSLSLYHPYPPISLGALRVHSQRLYVQLADSIFWPLADSVFWPLYDWTLRTWGKRWLFLQPLHAIRPILWSLAFKASWPLRKCYYFVVHFLTKGKLSHLWAGIFAAAIKWIQFFNDRLIVQPYHRIKPKLWEIGFKASWPFRKAYYIARYLFRTHILKQKKKP